MAKDDKLSRTGAVWNAFSGCDIEYFPRVEDGGKHQTLTSAEVLAECANATAGLADMAAATGGSISSDGARPSEVLEAALKHGRESLDEVKEQTEYQDQKALRLLTITTFLSALSGALFVRFSDVYPLAPFWARLDWRALPLAINYGLYAIFVLCAVAGALVVFHATRSRFRYPSTDLDGAGKGPGSHLFVRAILGLRPSVWAASFVEQVPGQSGLQPRADISARYLANYIGESYLVAAKVADKLRYLEPAQEILAIALRCLLLWLISTGFTVVFVPSTRPPTRPTPIVVRIDAPKPTVVRIEERVIERVPVPSQQVSLKPNSP